MPTVPRRDQTAGIATTSLPGVRAPTDVPARAFGSPETIDLRSVQRNVTEIVDRERAKADEIALLDADNQLAKLQSDLSVKAQQRKGKDAFGATAEIQGEWDQGVGDIESTLGNDEQKLRFRHAVNSRGQSLYAEVERHAADEGEKYDAEVTQAAVNNRINDALTSYRDPQTVAKAAVELNTIVKQRGERQGWAPEVTESRAREQVSRLHAGVIGRFLKVGDDLAAKAYYEKWKSQIIGEHQENVDAALEEGSTLGQAQRNADQILATKGITRSAAFDKAYAVEDAKVRQATVQQLDDRYARQDRVEREQHSDFLKRAAEYADRGELAPASLRAQLTAPERRSLESYRRSVVRGEPIETDWSTYYELRQKASDPKTRAEFLKTNLLRYRDKLANSEFEELIKLQTNVGQSGDRAQRGFLTDMDIVQKTIEPLFPDSDRSTGKGRDQKRARDAFIREIDVAVQDEKERIGKATLPSETVQKIADAMVLRRAFASGKLGVDERDNADQQYLTADKQGRPVVPTEQIPESERTKLFGFLRRNRLAASTSKIERLYAAILLRVPQATFDRIAQEP